MSGLYRREAKAIGIVGSVWNCDAVGVSGWGHVDLCQGESGSGASLGAAIAMSDRTLCAFRDGVVFRDAVVC